jgi:hypothetical protein
MGRNRLPNKRKTQILQLESKIADAQKAEAPGQGANSSHVTQPAVPYAWLWLVIAFLLPNLGALACGFVYDDRFLIVEHEPLHVHSLGQLFHLWVSGNAPSTWVQHYRPVGESVWAVAWSFGDGKPLLFHSIGLLLGLAVVILLYRFLLTVKVSPRVAFITALLFAIFPIHTAATTAIEGTPELLAAAFGLGALICFYRNRPITAVVLFALAVFSKESAAAFAALPLVFPRKDWRSRGPLFAAICAAVIIAAVALAYLAINHGDLRNVPPELNEFVAAGIGPRVLTSLWVQVMYLFKTLVPVTLSADYSFNQIPLVMGFHDWRAWAGIALAAGALLIARRYREFRAPIVAYAILFSPTANLLFPIGDMLEEQLVYAPSIALALLLGILLARTRYWRVIVVSVALVFAARTAVRNLDWRNDDVFFNKMAETSPNCARAHVNAGSRRLKEGDYPGAIEEYDRAISIMPKLSARYDLRKRL